MIFRKIGQNKGLICIVWCVFLLAYSANAQQADCDYKVDIIVNGTEFASEDFVWRMGATKIDGMPTNITGTAKIADSNGKIIKNYKPWTSDSISKQKTSNEYSPNLKDGEDYTITAMIDVACNDINKNNNIDSKKIRIRNEQENQTEVQDKNNTQSPIAQSPISESKNISANYDINSSKKQETETKYDSNIKNNRYSSEKETLAIPPKNSTENKMIDNIIYSKNNPQKNKLTSHAVEEPKIVFESSSQKAKDLMLIILLVFSLLLNIILIWKR